MIIFKSISRYNDGEVSVQIDENVRGRHVFILQSCGAPVNDNIIELLLTVSAVKRSSASRVTAVVPYFGYKHHRFLFSKKIFYYSLLLLPLL